MATLNETHGFTCQIGTSQVFTDGSTSVPVPVTVTGLNGSFAGSVASGTAITLWNTSNAVVSTFTIMFIITDQVGTIEFQTNSSAANNSNLTLFANAMFVFPGNGLAYNASGGFAGAAQAITKVSFKQSSGSAANVRAWFFN